MEPLHFFLALYLKDQTKEIFKVRSTYRKPIIFECIQIDFFFRPKKQLEKTEVEVVKRENEFLQEVDKSKGKHKIFVDFQIGNFGFYLKKSLHLLSNF